MQSSSEQPLVGEERYVTTLITAAKETIVSPERNWKQCLCKILGHKQRILWYFPKWPIVFLISSSFIDFVATNSLTSVSFAFDT